MKNKKEKTEKSDSIIKWCIEVVIITFILSILFSYISANGVSKLSILPAILILIAVTVANEDEFHAKASKKIAGSKTSIKLIKNAPRVANICADVVGDICGVLSGAVGTLVSIKIVEKLGVSDNIQYFVSALIASAMIGGKALGKEFGISRSSKIVHSVGKIINKFQKNEKGK